MDKWEHYLALISTYVVLIPLLVGLVFFFKHSNTVKLVLVLVGLASISQIATLLIFKDKNYTLYNLFIFFELSIWALIFYLSINKSIRGTIIIFFSAFAALFLNTFFLEGISKRFFSELVCLDNLFQVLWVCIYFYQVFKSDDLFKIELNPMFWFSMAILIYAPCTYFLFAFKKLITQNHSLSYLWSIHSILNTFYYLLIAVGVWVNAQNIKTQYKWKHNI